MGENRGCAKDAARTAESINVDRYCFIIYNNIGIKLRCVAEDVMCEYCKLGERFLYVKNKRLCANVEKMREKFKVLLSLEEVKDYAWEVLE